MDGSPRKYGSEAETKRVYRMNRNIITLNEMNNNYIFQFREHYTLSYKYIITEITLT
jgi:hypothetical protein